MLFSEQKNVKVHFAGAEDLFSIPLDAAGVNYRLYSCYKYILNKNKDDDFRLPENTLVLEQIKTSRHVIQDSGLFTLMFGAGKNQKHDKQDLIDWQDKLVQFVLQNKLDVTVVEIDAQKILGAEETWFFRERMKKMLPNNRQINVFHFEDGKKGLDRIIDFSDYIAFSVPELRIVKPKTFKQDTYRLVQYAKNRKPEIDIHLLGCTDFQMLHDNKIVTSADSTSWLQGVKYGHINDGNIKAHINLFKNEIFEERKKDIVRIFDEKKIKITPKATSYYTNASICATICKKRYTKVAGDQN